MRFVVKSTTLIRSHFVSIFIIEKLVLPHDGSLFYIKLVLSSRGTHRSHRLKTTMFKYCKTTITGSLCNVLNGFYGIETLGLHKENMWTIVEFANIVRSQLYNSQLKLLKQLIILNFISNRMMNITIFFFCAIVCIGLTWDRRGGRLVSVWKKHSFNTFFQRSYNKLTFTFT